MIDFPEPALETNRVLREYLAIQNRLFRFSFKKALGFIRPDPLAAARDVAPLRERLRGVREGIKELNPSEDSQRRFLMALRAYVREMDRAMGVFQELCHTLEEHKKDRKYRKEGYPRDMKHFQESEAQYLEIGLSLNEIARSDEATKSG
ncbi:MAG: hypothetical protein CSA35_01445 [Dethiosulfovibrio peptidovorans]|nr:MAG: hypothetical protein CSA35_01445 [Dethiosulfovibrio peptidovorans]